MSETNLQRNKQDLVSEIRANLNHPAEAQKRIMHAMKEGFGDSRDTSINHQVVTMGIGINIQLALSLIPGMDALFAAQMVTDLVNPYDYLNSLSRSGLDGMSQNMIDSVVTQLKAQAPQIVDQTYAQLVQAGVKTTKQEIAKLVDTQTNYWSVVELPQPQSTCYGDFAKYKTLSGPPDPTTCNSLYTNFYDVFVSTNIDDYVNGNYSASQRLYQKIISNNISAYRSGVIKIFTALTIGIVFLVIIFFILRSLRRK